MLSIIRFLKQVSEKRYLLYQLTKRDFTSKYVDSYLGLAWALLEPLATTIILSVIFIFGFKAGMLQDIPFFLYVFSGMVAYNFFSMAAGEGTNVIRNYSFLVKKVDFKLALLPVMKNLSCTIFHFIMLGLLVITLMFYEYYPTLYWFQSFYYFIAMNLLVLGLTLLTSAVTVFIPDIRHIVTISLQFLFYLSPVFWSVGNIPQKWAFLPKLNPMFYIVNGYRDSFIYQRPFWTYPEETIYFWTITFSLLFFGSSVFRRLRPQFADVI
jgi:lipopolysaccharide transport system permease protein